uniref:POU domain protein n=1 Tax=Parascaris univalens TaxID=6257 RepID=A0A915AHJ7_PARUN
MQNPPRLYPGLNQIASGTYSPSNPYRSRMQPLVLSNCEILCKTWLHIVALFLELSTNTVFDVPEYADTEVNPPKNFQTNAIFGTFDDPLFQARAAQAALAEMDVKNVNMATGGMLRPSDMFTSYHPAASHLPSSSAEFDSSSIVQNSSIIDSSMNHASDSMASLQQVMAMQHYPAAQFPQYPMASPFATATAVVASPSAPTMPRYPLTAPANEIDTDPRELERFAEHFKQRRIKLGVTQADVGKALAHLKMPGVGSLSQSTICRFESLTLSHNNMVALKPILHSWLDKAEEAMKAKDSVGDTQGILPNTDKKRKRTSIAAPEKRLLEDYFRQQPRPSGERISAIADKLDLKKNVVRRSASKVRACPVTSDQA